MKILLIVLINLLLICPARAEQKIYYHYIDIYSSNRNKENDPVEIKQFLKEGWKVTHVTSTGCGRQTSQVVVVYILEKEDK